MALWRRVFEQKERELAEKELEETAEILRECWEQRDGAVAVDSSPDGIGGSTAAARGVNSPFAVQARQDFLRGIAERENNKTNHHRSVFGSRQQPGPTTQSSSTATAAPGSSELQVRVERARLEREVIHERVLHEPNLAVDGMHLPQ